ncbi:MAG: hypothetical protein LBL18_04370 [Bacteroidales bacterium]|jgi:hypothetical protein|nr:hypothetical protein [Bacteroidales bacterium]
MIRFIEHQDIDHTKWNAAIERSSGATIFACYEFLTAANPKWCALIKGDYEAVMPLPCRTKWNLHYIYTPRFLSRLGLFAPPDTPPHLLSSFFEAIPKRFIQIDMVLNTHNYTPATTETLTLCSHQLSLNQPYSTICQKYSENHKRNLKKTVQAGLQYRENGSVAEIIELFKQNRGKEKGVHFTDYDYDFLLQISCISLKMRILDVVTVTSKADQLLCGALFLKEAQRTWFWFSGRDARFVEQKAMFFLLDEYIKRHDNQPVILDFNGSMNENIARFYRGFGGKKYEVAMWHYSRNILIKMYRRFKKMH